jgi:adenosylhomocysteinase
MNYLFTSESGNEGHPDKIAILHLNRLGVEHEELNKDQDEYIGLKVEGPFKPEY